MKHINIRWTIRFLLLFAAMVQNIVAQETTNQPAPAMTAEEAHFTKEQLNDYYLVYTNDDVRYLRTVFDAYLHGNPGKEKEYELLKKWSNDYFRSKFTVMSRTSNTFGGTILQIMFRDHPDRVFILWIYESPDSSAFELRAFDDAGMSDERMQEIRIRYRSLIDDSEHAM